MNKLFYLFPLMILLSSCTAQNVVRYTVASTTADCVGVGPQKCLLVKRGDATEWSFFHSRIEGFTHEEGYEYVLDVRETQRESVPADASSIRFELVRQISREAKTSENLPQSVVAARNRATYQWGGKVLSIENENIGRGGAQGRMPVVVVQVEVTHSSTDTIKEGDVVYGELISSPTVMPVVGREYIFKANSLHPAHARGVYFLGTDVQDLVR